MNKTIIPIFYTIDEGYANLATVSITSLIARANPDHEYNIHVVYQELPEATITRLRALAKPGFNIILNELGEAMDFITERSGTKLNNSIWTISIFFRLFLPEAFPDYDKGIYLDADTVLAGDISELYFTDLEGKAIGACHDLSIAAIPDFTTYINRADGVPFENYVNSGVLLMDMQKLRELKLRDSFLRIFTTYHPETVAPDQDYLNAMLLGNIKYLDPAWDAMPTPALAPIAAPKLVHYNLFFKPWHCSVDYEDYFWQAARAAGLEDHFRAIRIARTAEDAAADEAGLNMLLATARRITAENSGLASVFEKEKHL